jgi:hypothetical protein
MPSNTRGVTWFQCGQAQAQQAQVFQCGPFQSGEVAAQAVAQAVVFQCGQATAQAVAADSPPAQASRLATVKTSCPAIWLCCLPPLFQCGQVFQCGQTQNAGPSLVV